LLTLFGASPALCAGFVEGRPHELVAQGPGTLRVAHATSLRMGRLGYQSDAQASISASFNSLDSYAASLHGAMTTPYPAYEKVGVLNPGGEYNQLATTLLQIENEFYGTIRPKRTIRSGERPLHALRERGVEYIEVRCMDLDPFEPLGINAATMRFIDLFLLHCLASDSPPDTPAEIASMARNQHRTASHGREPGLRLERNGSEVPLVDWARQLVDECGPLAEMLDAVHGGNAYAQALTMATERLADLESTPSARALKMMDEAYEGEFAAFALDRSSRTKQQLLALPFDDAENQRWLAMARTSLAEQKRIEAADTQDFESFRLDYVSELGLTPVA
jgi:glutamate--cysteine ligase